VKNTLFILCLCLSALFPLSSNAEFLYEPVVIGITASTGKGVGVVTFVNPFQKPARIQLSLSEWEVGQNNKYTIKTPAEGEETITKYIKVSPLQFTLNPGQKKTVRIACAIPSKFPDGEYKLFLSMLEIGADRKVIENGENDNKQVLGLSINRQTNAGTYIRKGSNFKCDLTIPKLEVERQNFQDQDIEKTVIKYKVTYANEGNVHTRKDIGLRVFAPGGAVIFERKYIDTLIAYPLPKGQTITVEKQFTLPEKLEAGQPYDIEFGFTPSPDDFGHSSCVDQTVVSEKIRI
jgi:hypothetical protein